ncbi:MAG TPA: GNAT family acetyltransferase [Candidatus Kapabacteria bacterium]|nr:GNAT family acetyltransferase [Candidatus Kapabacteria bacterium]
MRIRPYQTEDEAAVIELWRGCGLVRPVNDPGKDIHRKLQVRPDLFLVGVEGSAVVATVMAGYEGHRGCVNYVAVSPEHRRKGYGRQIMEEAERMLRQAGCPKINLNVRIGNEAVIEFYKSLGYAVDNVIGMGKRLVNDEHVIQHNDQ